MSESIWISLTKNFYNRLFNEVDFIYKSGDFKTDGVIIPYNLNSILLESGYSLTYGEYEVKIYTKLGIGLDGIEYCLSPNRKLEPLISGTFDIENFFNRVLAPFSREKKLNELGI